MLCKGEEITPEPLSPAKGLIAVRPSGPTLHPPLSPGLLGPCGDWWCQIVPHGALSFWWDIRPGKKARICLAGASSVGVRCFQPGSFLQSIQTEPALVGGRGLEDIPSKDVCQGHGESAPHICSWCCRCKRPHSNPHGSYIRGFIHPSKTRN